MELKKEIHDEMADVDVCTVEISTLTLHPLPEQNVIGTFNAKLYKLGKVHVKSFDNY